MDLIDVGPENSKEIIRVARLYKTTLSKRIDLLAQEVEHKHKLLELINNAHLQRLPDGRIRFKVEGYTITVTPRDELVKIKEDSEAA